MVTIGIMYTGLFNCNNTLCINSQIKTAGQACNGNIDEFKNNQCVILKYCGTNSIQNIFLSNKEEGRLEPPVSPPSYIMSDYSNVPKSHMGTSHHS